MATEKKTPVQALVISPPNFEFARFHIIGDSPLVMHAFGAKAIGMMLDSQTKAGAKNKKREPRDLDAEMKAAMHVGMDGKVGFPCSAIRMACIDACRAAGFTMTKAKMSVFCDGDTFDEASGVPLFHIKATEPERSVLPVRLESGVASIAVRPMWREWEAFVGIRWDADQFSMMDVAHLLMRAGLQVGIGEGRHYSKKSAGMGWGCFRLKSETDEEQTA